MSRVRRVRVAEVVAETDEARSVVFEVPPGETKWFRARPGQFLTVRVPLGEGDGVARCYSLSSGPDERPTITVKRAGPASAWLVDHLEVGQELDLLPPAGRFTPASPDADLLLVAAGSGITPVMAILRWMLATGSGHVALVYANRDPDAVIFARQLELLRVRHPGRLDVVHWLESERGLPFASALAGELEPWAARETYLCGPQPFMAEASTALQGLEGHGRLHVERYDSLTEDPFAVRKPPPSDQPEDDGPAAVEGEGNVVEVEIEGEKHRLSWAPGITMLEAMERGGVDAPFSCREGNCGACTGLLLEGQVRMRTNDSLDAEDLAEGYVLACQSDPETPVVRVSYD